jgi:hypothetical protein
MNPPKLEQIPVKKKISNRIITIFVVIFFLFVLISYGVSIEPICDLSGMCAMCGGKATFSPVLRPVSFLIINVPNFIQKNDWSKNMDDCGNEFVFRFLYVYCLMILDVIFWVIVAASIKKYLTKRIKI